MTIVKLLGLIALGLLLQWWWTADERENNAHINPSVFWAFREVEARCAAEQHPYQTVRCQGALEFMRQCAASELSCSAGQYYDRLLELGFFLPPFYEHGYVPK